MMRRAVAMSGTHQDITETKQAELALVDQVNRIERDLGSPILVRANAGRSMQLTPVGFQVVAAVAVMAGRINEGASQSSGSCSPRSVPGPAGPRATAHTGSP